MMSLDSIFKYRNVLIQAVLFFRSVSLRNPLSTFCGSDGTPGRTHRSFTSRVTGPRRTTRNKQRVT